MAVNEKLTEKNVNDFQNRRKCLVRLKDAGEID